MGAAHRSISTWPVPRPGREDRLAVLHLLEGERVAAQAISRNAAALSLLGELLARERKGATPGLRALATRAEVLQ